MKISALSTQKKDNNRVNMFLDGEFACGISVNTIAKYNLFVGKEITSDEYQEILLSDFEERLFNRATNYLNMAIKSKRQVKTYINTLLIKKKGKWFSHLVNEQQRGLVDKVLAKLEEYSYINDGEYAEQFILSRIKNKPRGKGVLLSELLSKGISKDLAQEKLDLLVEDEYAMLEQAYRKKFKDVKLQRDDRKKIDFLLRKGFNWSLIETFFENESEK